MPWQRDVAAVATEYDPVTGVPFWREVFVTTPRQAGKTSLILALCLDRCLGWDDPQVCAWTGQSGSDIRRKWMQELVPNLERSDLAHLIHNVRRAMGAEQIAFVTGSRIELLSTSENAGHGLVLDLVVLDEIFADHDNRREAALLPAMATKRAAQMLTCSTAGTASSLVYNRKVRSGRKAVLEDADRGLAYFEWSAPDDWDPNDDESFTSFHPAVGHTIDLDVIRQARETFEDEPGEFARAYGNRPMLDGSSVIPDVTWAKVVDRSAEPDTTTPLVLGLDVSPDRDTAAIAICDADGTVELLEHRGGVGWLVDRAAELADTYDARLVFDGRGPAGSVDGLAGLRCADPWSSGDVIGACGKFFDAVVEGRVRVRQDDAVDRAVRGLEKKTVGDAYVWSRRASSKDVTPLYAVTLAYAASRVSVGAPAGAMYVRS